MGKVYHTAKSKIKDKLLVSIIVWLFFTSSLLWLSKSILLGYYPDYTGYYYGSSYAFNGQNPYLGGGYLYTSYVYPPFVLLLFLPITLLNFQISSYFWTALNICILIFSLGIMSGILDIKFLSNRYLVLMGLAFMSFPIKFTLGMGQINLFILFFVILSLYFLQKNKKTLAGTILAFSLIIKFIPIFLPFYFFVKKEFRVLFGIFLGISFSVILVLIFIPKQIFTDFFTVFPTLLNSWKLDYYNQALSGFIGRSFGVSEFSNILKIIISLFLLTLTFAVLIISKTKNYPLVFGVLLTLNLIINNFSWQHHFVLLIIPFLVSYSEISKLKNKKFYLFVLIISYILVSANFKNPNILPLILRSHVLYGSLILLILQLIFFLDRKNIS